VGCPVEATLAVIGGKWKAVPLFPKMHTGHRFAELQRKTTGISDGVLTRQLREWRPTESVAARSLLKCRLGLADGDDVVEGRECRWWAGQLGTLRGTQTVQQ
jgi:hypothetical protein